MMLRPKLDELPDPFIGGVAWERFWREFPGSVARSHRPASQSVRVRGPCGSSNRRGDRRVGRRRYRRRFRRRRGAPVRFQRPLFCRSSGGLAVHRATGHGQSSAGAIKQVLAGAFCPACGQDFQSRLRAIQHRPRGVMLPAGSGGWRAAGSLAGSPGGGRRCRCGAPQAVPCARRSRVERPPSRLSRRAAEPHCSVLSSRPPVAMGQTVRSTPSTRWTWNGWYRCVRNSRRARPYEFIGLGTMDVTKPCKFKWFADFRGRMPNE